MRKFGEFSANFRAGQKFAIFRRKSPEIREFRRITFSLLFHNTVYLIKLTEQKDANVILTQKCFTIAIKTIQLSSHITKHDEFIKATFSSEIFFETNNTFAIT